MPDFEQLSLSELHKTEIRNIQVTRATKVTMEFTHGFGVSTNITSWRYFWRKKERDDTNQTVVLSLSSTYHSAQMDLTTSGEGILTIDDEDTRGLDTSLTYDHGLEMIGTGNVEIVPFVGDAKLLYEVVEDSESAPYLSKTTKAVMDANLDALFDCAEAGVLSAQVVPTGVTFSFDSVPVTWVTSSTITVNDGTNYEALVVNTISGTDVVFSSGATNTYEADYTIGVLGY